MNHDKLRMQAQISPKRSNIKSIKIARNLVVAKLEDIKSVKSKCFKYVGLYHFNIGSTRHSSRMSKSLKRIKYLIKVGNVVIFNATKANSYEEAFKSSYKTTFKWQNRFSLSKPIPYKGYFKYLNKILYNPILLHERMTKCPIKFYICHKTLRYLSIGKVYFSLDRSAQHELSEVFRKLKKLEILKLTFERLDLFSLYDLILKDKQILSTLR